MPNDTQDTETGEDLAAVTLGEASVEQIALRLDYLFTISKTPYVLGVLNEDCVAISLRGDTFQLLGLLEFAKRKVE